MDRALGELASESVMGDARVCTNPRLVGAVTAVVSHLEVRLDPVYRPLTVRVVEDETVNAFALPGGHVFVMTGLLRAVESPDELAGVLGHELPMWCSATASSASPSPCGSALSCHG